MFGPFHRKPASGTRGTNIYASTSTTSTSTTSTSTTSTSPTRTQSTRELLQRGEMQKVKAGARKALEVSALVATVAAMPHRWKLMELYGSMCELTLQANTHPA